MPRKNLVYQTRFMNLFEAVGNNDLVLTKALLAKAYDPNEKLFGLYRTPLSFASSQWNLEVVRILLDSGLIQILLTDITVPVRYPELFIIEERYLPPVRTQTSLRLEM